MRRALVATIALAALGAACNADGAEVIFSVRSDLRPGVEFDRVQTALFDGDAAFGIARTFERDVALSEDFAAGQVVAEFGNVPSGPNVAQVRLLLAGTVVLARNVRLDVDGPLGVTIVMSRNCIGVMCPLPDGDPAYTACVAGRCAPPTCTIESPELCGAPACMRDEDCAAPVACATSSCTDGACIVTPDDGLCASGEVCDAALGCTSPPNVGCSVCGGDGTCTESCDGACVCPDGCDCTFTCDGPCRVECDGDTTQCHVMAAEADVTCLYATCDIQVDMGNVECRGTEATCTVMGGDVGITCDRATCTLDLGSGTIDCISGAQCAARCAMAGGWTNCIHSVCCWEGPGCGGGVCTGPDDCRGSMTSDGTPVERCGEACPPVENGCFAAAP